MRKSILLTLSFLCLVLGCKKNESSRGEGRLDVDRELISVPKEGLKDTVKITSNCYWNVSATDETGRPVTWIAISTERGSGDCELQLTFIANIKTSERVALVEISSPNSASLTKIIRVVQEAGDTPSVEGYSFPICQTIDIDNPTDHKLINATLAGNVCLFKGGMSISWIKQGGGVDGNILWSCPSHTQPSSDKGGTEADRSIHRSINLEGFAQGDTIRIEIPVKDELFGDLRLMLGARAASFTAAGWEYYWSNDGESWYKILIDNAVTPGSDAVWNIIYFIIPESSKVKAGGTLYFKIASTGTRSKEYVCISNAICVCDAKAKASSLPAMDYTEVAFSHGFDDLLDCKAAYAELPIGWMRSATTGYATNYTSFNSHYVPSGEQDGILTTSGCYGRPGYLQVGYYDESLWVRQCIGTYTIKIGERLKAMGVSLADCKLTFNAAEFKDFRGYDPIAQVFVKCGTDSVAIKIPEGKFSEFSAEFKNIDQNSTIVISSHRLSNDEIAALGRGDNAKNLIDNRFYIDDVLVKLTEIHAKGAEAGGSNEDFGNGGIYNW